MPGIVDAEFAPLETTNRIDSTWLKAPVDPVRLGPGDLLEIEMLGEMASRTTVRVGPDGRIYYSLLPGLSVWGLTLSETKASLEREISRFTRNKPELVVTLRSVGSQRLWILGAVDKPGAYPMAAPVTLLEALAAVGGATMIPGSAESAADLQNSFVMRDGRMLPVDLDRLLNHGDLTQNIYLQNDDFIFIRSASMRSVYLLGAVANPNILPYTEEMSLAATIIAAGGTVPYARQSKAVIVRGGLMHPQIAEVDYKAIVTGKTKDVRLQPGDIVYVPFSPYRKLAQFAEEMLDQFVRTVAINEGQNLIIPDSRAVTPTLPFGFTP